MKRCEVCGFWNCVCPEAKKPQEAKPETETQGLDEKISIAEARAFVAGKNPAFAAYQAFFRLIAEAEKAGRDTVDSHWWNQAIKKINANQAWNEARNETMLAHRRDRRSLADKAEESDQHGDHHHFSP